MSASSSTRLTLPDPRPFYETVETRHLILIMGMASAAVSLWFLTAGIVRISLFPPDSLYYLRQLPITYWLGLAATLSLLFIARSLEYRFRILLELSSLFLLGLYVIGLPSFVYEGPRILDSYAHMSNTLIIINDQGWLGSASWYTRNFPGAYTFYAQLISLAGINPFDLMKYWAIASFAAILLFTYTIARSYNPDFAATVSALLLGGFWFQLHYSPQSLELIPYLGVLYIFTKVVSDKPRQNLWTALAILSIPAFVVSHPETPIVVILGTITLLIVSVFLKVLRVSADSIRPALPRIGVFFLTLLGVTLAWWFTYASEVRILIQRIGLGAISSLLSAHTAPAQTLPTTPAYSYQLVVLLEQGVSIIFWLLALSALLLSRLKFQIRDFPLWGMCLAAIATAPFTFYVRADMLQRSYLFSLLPGAILLAVVVARKSNLTIRRVPLTRLFKAALIIAVIVFIVLLPATRNGVDPYEYVPNSSLYGSAMAASLSQQSHSILFLANGEYAWRFYSSMDGYRGSIADEQLDLTNMTGGFVKVNSTVTVARESFNLTLTPSDKSSNYIVLSDYYQNLYLLRFGQQGAPFYVSQKNSFEGQVSVIFNLVYSTGTDRVYENRLLA